MMKANFKKFGAVSFSAFLLLAAVFYEARAQDAYTKHLENLLEAKNKAQDLKDQAAAQGLCERISNLAEKMTQKMDERRERIESRLEGKKENRISARNEVKSKLSNFRAEADEKRSGFYETLEEGAGTLEQKQAVADFQAAIEAAVKAKREAIDAALDNFHKGVDELIVSRNQNVFQLMSAYRTAVSSAFSAAGSACGEGTTPAEVRSKLHEELKAARESLKSQARERENIGSAISQLAHKKNEAIKKAVEDFRAAVKQAIADLKAAWPEAEVDEGEDEDEEESESEEGTE